MDENPNKPPSQHKKFWTRERFLALGTAVVMTIALPISIDQGYFRYNAYALPILGLLAAILYIALFLTIPAVKDYARKIYAINRGVATIHGTLLLAILLGGMTVGFRAALNKSNSHVEETRQEDAAARAAQNSPPTLVLPNPQAHQGEEKPSSKSPPKPTSFAQPHAVVLQPPKQKQEAVPTQENPNLATNTTTLKETSAEPGSYTSNDMSMASFGLINPVISEWSQNSFDTKDENTPYGVRVTINYAPIYTRYVIVCDSNIIDASTPLNSSTVMSGENINGNTITFTVELNLTGMILRSPEDTTPVGGISVYLHSAHPIKVEKVLQSLLSG